MKDQPFHNPTVNRTDVVPAAVELQFSDSTPNWNCEASGVVNVPEADVVGRPGPEWVNADRRVGSQPCFDAARPQCAPAAEGFERDEEA